MKHNTHKTILICLGLALFQALTFVGLQAWMTGRLCFPLDDSFIHLQYGKQIARGYFYAYQDGAAPTTGETSFLYAHLLAAGYFAGLRGIGLIFWAHAIAFVSVTAIFYLLRQLGGYLFAPWVGWTTVALVFFSGYLAWGFWSGMEIALFTALLLWVLYLALLARFDWLFWAMGLLALCRPEGGIVSLAILGMMVFDKPRPTLQKRRLFIILASFFFLAALITPNFANWLATGRMTGNSLLAKSLLYSPIMSFSQKMGAIAENLGAILLYLTGGLTPQWGEFIFPGLLIFSILGLLAIWKCGKRGYASLLALPLAAVLLAIATLEVWSLHSFRYLIAYTPLLTLLAIGGIHFLASQADALGLRLGYAVMAIFLLFTLSYYPEWMKRFATQATTIYEKQIQTAEWMGRNLPSHSHVAINDAGAIAYYGDFPILDLVGLVSNQTTIAYRLGEGGLYEKLEDLPSPQHPRYAAVFPSWFEELAKKYDIFHEPLAVFHDPFNPMFEKRIYHVNWDYAGMEDRPREATLQQNWVVKDSLDVASRESETSHQYQWENRDGSFPKIPVPFRRNFGYHDEIDKRWPGIENEQEELIPLMKEQGILKNYDIVDAGRRVTKEESFILYNLTPHREAYLIMRTCDGVGEYETFTYRMQVLADGIYLGDWTVSETPWNWVESVFTIPSDIVKSDSLQLKIRNMGTPHFAYFDSFYYWICQKK
ncbi:hypothetical protein GF373_03465 [bacterium]|nr:hypothetical protein [bacterium]